jgi:hypothetical protein
VHEAQVGAHFMSSTPTSKIDKEPSTEENGRRYDSKVLVYLVCFVSYLYCIVVTDAKRQKLRRKLGRSLGQ